MLRRPSLTDNNIRLNFYKRTVNLVGMMQFELRQPDNCSGTL
jgi:hypothetical protein